MEAAPCLHSMYFFYFLIVILSFRLDSLFCCSVCQAGKPCSVQQAGQPFYVCQAGKPFSVFQAGKPYYLFRLESHLFQMECFVMSFKIESLLMYIRLDRKCMLHNVLKYLIELYDGPLWFVVYARVYQFTDHSGIKPFLSLLIYICQMDTTHVMD